MEEIMISLLGEFCMSFEMFCKKVKSLVKNAGISELPMFSEEDDGRFVAKCDGVTIVGNSSNKSVKVSWNYGQHISVARLA